MRCRMMVRRMAPAGASSLANSVRNTKKIESVCVPSPSAPCHQVLDRPLQATRLILLHGVPRARVGRLPCICLLDR